MTTKTRRKVKLITTFVAMIMTLCMTCFGIMAATSIAYSGDGYFMLNAGQRIAATITGKYSLDGEVQNTITMPDQNNDGNATGEFVLDDEATPYSGSLELPNLTVTDLDSVYTFTFTVQNDMPSASLRVQFNPTVGDATHLSMENITYTLSDTATGVAATGVVAPDAQGWVTLPANQTLTMSVDFSVISSKENLENGFSEALYTIGLNVQRLGSTTVSE
jgi:hypothetical protein